jgi:hypothetical protein
MHFGRARGCGAVWTGVNAGSTWGLVSVVDRSCRKESRRRNRKAWPNDLAVLVMQKMR